MNKKRIIESVSEWIEENGEDWNEIDIKIQLKKNYFGDQIENSEIIKYDLKGKIEGDL